jgi:hypothetical protein
MQTNVGSYPSGTNSRKICRTSTRVDSVGRSVNGTHLATLLGMSPSARASIAPLAIALAALSGCAGSAAVPASDDITQKRVFTPSGDEGDDNIGDVSRNVSQGFAAGCGSNRDELLAAVRGTERETILQRGFDWLDKGVPYSQSDSFEGYRTDCSGFVSMAWGLGTSQTTSSFGSGEDCTELSSESELLPGDALNKAGRHVVLFLGKQGDSYCVLEQASSASDMQFRLRNLDGYTPIRRANDPGGIGGGGGGSDPTPSADSGCRSKTINKTVDKGVCVQSRSDDQWYQCVGSIWRKASETEGPAGECTEAFSL